MAGSILNFKTLKNNFMKLKIYFSIMAILMLSLKTFSQIDPLRQKLDSIFQYVDKTKIPTGILAENKSPPLNLLI